MDVALYSKDSPCSLPFRSLVELFKETKVGSEIQLRESAHQEVRDCAAPSGTGRKWKLYDRMVLKEDKSNLRLMKLLGSAGLVIDQGVIRRCELKLDNARLVGNVRQGRMGLDFAGVGRKDCGAKYYRGISRLCGFRERSCGWRG